MPHSIAVPADSNGAASVSHGGCLSTLEEIPHGALDQPHHCAASFGQILGPEKHGVES
jgi:hypothetical protein